MTIFSTNIRSTHLSMCNIFHRFSLLLCNYFHISTRSSDFTFATTEVFGGVFFMEKKKITEKKKMSWAKTWPGLVIPQKKRLLYNGRGEVRGDAS